MKVETLAAAIVDLKLPDVAVSSDGYIIVASSAYEEIIQFYISGYHSYSGNLYVRLEMNPTFRTGVFKVKPDGTIDIERFLERVKIQVAEAQARNVRAATRINRLRDKAEAANAVVNEARFDAVLELAKQYGMPMGKDRNCLQASFYGFFVTASVTTPGYVIVRLDPANVMEMSPAALAVLIPILKKSVDTSSK